MKTWKYLDLYSVIAAIMTLIVVRMPQWDLYIDPTDASIEVPLKRVMGSIIIVNRIVK